VRRFRRSPGRPKAGQLLEFSLLLPMALVLLTFSVDLGRLVLASTTLHASASSAARAGARVGYAGTVPAPGNCSGFVGNDNPSYEAFCESTQATAGAKIESFDVLTPTGGGVRFCVAGANSTQYVTVRAKASIDFVTPGLATLLGINTGDGASFEAVGTARCEVTR
jgi:Flp pilus assembly protein TadG